MKPVPDRRLSDLVSVGVLTRVFPWALVDADHIAVIKAALEQRSGHRPGPPWMQMLALTSHDARRWEPKRLRRRLLTVPATRPAPPDVQLHLAGRAPWAQLDRQALARLRALAAPGWTRPTRPDGPSMFPASGTGAYTERHSGPCHTPL